jgi:hypothetical protein
MWFWPTPTEPKQPTKKKGYKLVERTNEGKYILATLSKYKSYSVSLDGEMVNLGRYQKFVSTFIPGENYVGPEGAITDFDYPHPNRNNVFYFENGKIVFNMAEEADKYMFYNKGQTYHEQCDGYVYENTVGGKRRKTRRRRTLKNEH